MTERDIKERYIPPNEWGMTEWYWPCPNCDYVGEMHWNHESGMPLNQRLCHHCRCPVIVTEE